MALLNDNSDRRQSVNNPLTDTICHEQAHAHDEYYDNACPTEMWMDIVKQWEYANKLKEMFGWHLIDKINDYGRDIAEKIRNVFISRTRAHQGLSTKTRDAAAAASMIF